MTPAVALALALLAAEPERPLKLAAPGLGAINLDASLGQFYTEHVAQQLKLNGVEVITSKEIASMLGLERQKQLLGCGDDSASCMAELANALGAEGLLLGDVAKLGERYQVNLKIIRADTGKTLAVVSESVSSEGAVVDALTRGAQSLAVDAAIATGRTPPDVGPSRAIPIALISVGTALTAAGAVALVYSESAYSVLKTGEPGSDGAALKSTGQTMGTLGIVGLAVGGAALVSGVVMWLVTSKPAAPSTPSVSALFLPGGGAIVVGGTFP